ncbi:FtsK/SpoIIIE domain-containing protein [Streptomyces sp. TP-A0874]|uniref:FtsK/SpoIIIE domain-containing protein n=1 Tax=Streptomyces sp. TP-A0874 TaxID=549819 RepID=UPI00085291A3|nr:FtsK/SpoIIIE domain-containing protein [Streptomyces sp. TP-A0874]
MQIRLTVLGPYDGTVYSRDVLVTAPVGTALARVASGLADAVAAPRPPGVAAPPAGAKGAGTGPAVLYYGYERLDPQRCVLGEPPLVDGVVLSLNAPVEPGRHPGIAHEAVQDTTAPQLHVVSGPDAGGIHLLHGGPVRIGRSAGAEVPLSDPDVSRLHCVVTVTDDGLVTVADLGSTNGTVLDGCPLDGRPVPLPAGVPLRVGESTLRLVVPEQAVEQSRLPDAPARAAGATAGQRSGPLPTTPDGQGHLVVALGDEPRNGDRPGTPGPATGGRVPPQGGGATGQHPGWLTGTGAASPADPWGRPGQSTPLVGGEASARETGAGWEQRSGERPAGTTTHGSGLIDWGDRPAAPGMPAAGTEPPNQRRERGLGGWARRLTMGQREDPGEPRGLPDGSLGPSGAAPAVGHRWPDPAEVLLTALRPGRRLWERCPTHPDALVARLGTDDRPGAPGSPVTVDLRRLGALGLSGPRERLLGLSRSVLAQFAALLPPGALEIVLISAEPGSAADERRTDWTWLGWLPQLRPAHGQSCRLLLAHDPEQAATRLDELARRLDDGPLGPGWAAAGRAAVEAATRAHQGPYTVVVVDGDPGSRSLREATVRLAASGPACGVHLLCLAETPPASPSSPIVATYERARSISPAFAECGAVALLSGDVATALRLIALGPSGPVDNGVFATVDAVSAAWAERFARSLAPLRLAHAEPAGAADGSGPHPGHRPGARAALPQKVRLLDELGLARATPASLQARWAAAEGDRADGGRARAVLGTGPHGALSLDLSAEVPHLLVEGGPGSGKTELLRSAAASLAAADRPDRIALVLVDGAGTERGEGLRACTELPHVTTHLVASDPIRMRGFAQALSSELKRRAELLGDLDFAAWHQRRTVSERLVEQRRSGENPSRRGTGGPGDREPVRSRAQRWEAGAGSPAAAEIPADIPAGAPADEQGAAPVTTDLPRLVVLVDDFDALAAPALGSPGRPAAGSMVRALEAVAREGGRLGVHLVVSTGRPDLTADGAVAARAGLRVWLEVLPAGAEGAVGGSAVVGRGRLLTADGARVEFQAGRVTGRIPRTATLRPTVVPLDWARMGDPATRRPLRELGNGPTDLALLASALHRAAQSVSAEAGPGLL